MYIFSQIFDYVEGEEVWQKSENVTQIERQRIFLSIDLLYNPSLRTSLPPFHIYNRRDKVKPESESTTSIAVRFLDNPKHLNSTYGVLDEDTA